MGRAIDRRPTVGRLGEALAACFLEERGLEVVARNVRFEVGEIDIIGLVGGHRILIEVRTTTSEAHPDDLFPEAKRRRLRRLAGVTGCHRIDIVWVCLGRAGVWINWIPGAQ